MKNVIDAKDDLSFRKESKVKISEIVNYEWKEIGEEGEIYMNKKDKTQTIEVDGEMLYSDISNSKNVMKFCGDDSVVIFTNQGIKTWIRPIDVDELIKECSWNVDYSKKEVDIFNWDLGTVVGKKTLKEPRYLSATLTPKDFEDAENKVKKYNLDPELPMIKNFLKGKKIKIYLHRYIKRMYSINYTKRIKEQYGISDEEFNKSGLSSLEVHHMDANKMENYSDKMNIVPKKEHPHIKRENPNVYNFYGYQFPIGAVNEQVFLEIRNLNRGTLSAKVVDLDKSGCNISELKNYITIETRNKHDSILLLNDVHKGLERYTECNVELQELLLSKAICMENEGKVKIEYCLESNSSIA